MPTKRQEINNAIPIKHRLMRKLTKTTDGRLSIFDKTQYIMEQKLMTLKDAHAALSLTRILFPLRYFTTHYVVTRVAPDIMTFSPKEPENKLS